MTILIKDGVRYNPHVYKDERELQKIVESNIHFLFGPDSFFFPGTRIGAERGVEGAKGIPDGFVLVVPQKKWYVVEVELAKHSYFNHIAPQIMQFYAAWEDTSRRKKIKDRFCDAIKGSPTKMEVLANHGVQGEVYRFISDVLEDKPTLAVIIDRETKDLEQLKRVVQFDIRSSVFQTYTREGVSDLVPIYSYDSFYDAGAEGSSKPDGEEKEYLFYLGKEEPIGTTKEILQKVANELVKRGLLTENILPWGPGKKRFIVSKKPIHPGGNPFFAPMQLENGWWVETHYGRENILRVAQGLMKKCGIRNPSVTIKRS